ncbi:MAG: helix-turn-helix transcriptional regulator [Oscillospiraceae bacterium]|nr:helix-turn-helix transcriptional regulator [Oscillospiraceae bacterium]
MNYYEIGQRIRKYRKAHGMSQEQLAEKIGISVTHMSHIETANTKLSLSVFVDIARALEVQTDDLLSDNKGGKQIAEDEIIDILNHSSASQVRIIADIVKATKTALDKHS